jgi:hypothetical protein
MAVFVAFLAVAAAPAPAATAPAPAVRVLHRHAHRGGIVGEARAGVHDARVGYLPTRMTALHR